MVAVRGRHGLAVALVAACLGIAAMGVQTTTIRQSSCRWAADVLSLPPNAIGGKVTAGGGEWLAGETEDGEALLWRRGRLLALGRAFGGDTELSAVNANGIAVGTVDGRRAIRYRGGFESLPGGTSALDVNNRGDVVGYAGPDLVVWTTTTRRLAPPPGEWPFGDPSIDDDGTVVARTGKLDANGTLRWQVHAWGPDGTRRTLPASDGATVTAIRNGRVVGDAAVWAGGERKPLPRGMNAVAVNRGGAVVGTDDGENLIWARGWFPARLPTPRGYQPGTVTAVNEHEAGGYAFAPGGSVPVRWRCSGLT